MATSPIFVNATAKFDEANSADPNKEAANGKEVPKELLYGQRMSAWLEKLAPNASDIVKLAVRSQHLCRWKIPRTDYPDDRVGYLKWRTDLAKMHADMAGNIMQEVGYAQTEIERVQTLLRKRNIKGDAEVQLLEDTACLVFLDHYLADFVPKHDEAKLINIVQKTWIKMSEQAHTLALKISFKPDHLALIKKALAEDTHVGAVGQIICPEFTGK